MNRATRYGVILAGGSGTRFWPLSRKHYPKQFLNFEPEQSLIQSTYHRLSSVFSATHTHVVCGVEHAPLVHTQLPHLPVEQVLVEPAARNTAPAVLLAAYHLFHMCKDAVMAITPADHYVADLPTFKDVLLRALDYVQEAGGVILLGMVPTHPDTGFGYIKCGDKLSSDLYRVARFVEKPMRQLANEFVLSGSYYWNAGIFVCRAVEMIQLFAKYVPEWFSTFEQAAQSALASHGIEQWYRAPSFVEIFMRLPAISIDYAIMEKTSSAKVMPVECGWSDVGSFDAIAEIREPDAQGNVCESDVLLIDAHHNIVKKKDHKLVCLLGVDNLIVVDTEDATLIMKRHDSQRVREVVMRLERTHADLL